MKVTVNLEDFKPHEKVRIQFLREVEFRMGMGLMMLTMSPLLGLIGAFGTKKEGGDFWEGFVIVLAIVIVMTIPLLVVSLIQNKEINQLFFPYIDYSYKWVIYDYEENNLIFANDKKSLIDSLKKDESEWSEKLLFFVKFASRFRIIRTSQIKKRQNQQFHLIDEIVMIPYYCFIWPLLGNPMQLAFLEYDKLKKYHKIQKGATILILGAGAIPHHIRYKRAIGEDGKIVVSDNNRPALFMSKGIEVIYEFVVSLFGVKRPKVEYKIVDSTDDFPLEKNSFDIIVGIRNYYVDYDECKRVLKKDGVIYLTNLGDWFSSEPPEENVKYVDTNNSIIEYQLVS